jgi:hypothetical protein
MLAQSLARAALTIQEGVIKNMLRCYAALIVALLVGCNLGSTN